MGKVRLSGDEEVQGFHLLARLLALTSLIVYRLQQAVITAEVGFVGRGDIVHILELKI